MFASKVLLDRDVIDRVQKVSMALAVSKLAYRALQVKKESQMSSSKRESCEEGNSL